MECITAVMIQFIGAVTTLFVLHYCLISESLAQLTFDPIEYSSSASGDGGGNLWFVVSLFTIV